MKLKLLIRKTIKLLLITILVCMLLGSQALASMQEYQYDSNGKLRSVTLPSGEKESMQYDGNGNLLGVQNPGSVPSKYFDGTDSVIINIDSNLTPGGKNTVAFWMYWDGTENAMPITWGSQAYALWMYEGAFGFNTGQSNIVGISSASLKQKWVHVVAVFYNGTPNVTDNELYINGIKQTISPLIGGAIDARNVGGTLVVSYLFKGRIANLQVWNRQLSADEIQSSMYKMQSGDEAGLLGEWKLVDQPGTSKVFDRTNQVTLRSAVIDTTPGGKNTVSFWMNWDGTDNAMPFAWGGSHYTLWFYGGSFGFNSGQGNIIGISSANLKQKWVHVTAVFYNGIPNATDNELYIDGIKQTITLQMGETTIPKVASQTVVLSGWDGTNDYRFGGRIGHLQIWNHAVEPSQVQSFMYKVQVGNSSPEKFMLW